MRIKARFEANPPTQPAAAPIPAPRAADCPSPSSAAKNLALAHHLDRLIERGLVADFTAAARMLGISQPRLTHVMGLLLLAPEVQTAILFNELHFGDKELRRLARIAAWDGQKSAARLGHVLSSDSATGPGV